MNLLTRAFLGQSVGFSSLPGRPSRTNRIANQSRLVSRVRSCFLFNLISFSLLNCLSPSCRIPASCRAKKSNHSNGCLSQFAIGFHGRDLLDYIMRLITLSMSMYISSHPRIVLRISRRGCAHDDRKKSIEQHIFEQHYQ